MNKVKILFVMAILTFILAYVTQDEAGAILLFLMVWLVFTYGFPNQIANRKFHLVSEKTFIKDFIVHFEDTYDVAQITEIYNSIRLPERATGGSFGYDIFSPIDFELNPNQEITIPLGWKIELPDGEGLFVIPRSGQGYKFYLRLANTVGLIDSDYFNNVSNEGHCSIKIRIEGDKPIKITSGQAIAQCFILSEKLIDGDNFSGKSRVGGFGSTG